MSQQNRTILKNYFRTGNRPTQEQFADLIDSSLNLADNDLFEAGGNLGLGHDQPAATLSINGNLNVSPNNDLAPDHGLFVHGNVGIGAGFTNPTAQLAVNGGVYIGDNVYRDPGQNGLRVDGVIMAGGNVLLDNDSYVATDKVRALDDSGLKLTEAGGKGLLIRHRSGSIETDSSLKIADGSSPDYAIRVKARDNTGLRLCVDGGGKGLRILDASADLMRTTGNLTLADGKYLETDRVKARDSSGLKLFEANNKGLTIADSSGDASFTGHVALADGKYLKTYKVQARDRTGLKLFEANNKGLTIADASGDASFNGHVTLADGKCLKTDKVQARDNSGLNLAKRDGAVAMKIHDNGHISLGTETKTNAKVNIGGDLEATSLKLTAAVLDTDYYGSKGGSKHGSWTINAADGKVVTGLKFERWRSGDGDKDYYRIALRYR